MLPYFSKPYVMFWSMNIENIKMSPYPMGVDSPDCDWQQTKEEINKYSDRNVNKFFELCDRSLNSE
jgi:hypothetical protein